MAKMRVERLKVDICSNTPLSALWQSGTGMWVQTQEGGLKGVVWVWCRHAGVVMESQGVFKFV